jgi:hypothetical protein
MNGGIINSVTRLHLVGWFYWIIPDVVLIQLSSWGWTHSCSKHVEDLNKHIIEEIVRQVGYLPEVSTDASWDLSLSLSLSLYSVSSLLALVTPWRWRLQDSPKCGPVATALHTYQQPYRNLKSGDRLIRFWWVWVMYLISHRNAACPDHFHLFHRRTTWHVA